MTKIDLPSVAETLNDGASKLSPALANTTTDDRVGRDIRNADNLIGLGARAVYLGIRSNASPVTILGNVRGYTSVGLVTLRNVREWLTAHPDYVSQASDGKRPGQKVPGRSILKSVSEALAVIETILAPERIAS